MTGKDATPTVSAPPVARVRLLLVDDHGLFREGLGRLLADEPDLLLVAQCSSLAEVRAVLQQAAPSDEAESLLTLVGDQSACNQLDLMLLDFDLGEHSAFDVLKAARALGFKGHVLLVTAGMSSSEIEQALEQGAAGVFLKHSPPGELLLAIRQVMRGERWLHHHSPAESLANRPDVRGADRRHERLSTPRTLTPRERAVLRGVFEGLVNKEIGARLDLSEGSIKAVLQQLFAKTGVRSRAQLVRIALENRYEYELESD